MWHLSSRRIDPAARRVLPALITLPALAAFVTACSAAAASSDDAAPRAPAPATSVTEPTPAAVTHVVAHRPTPTATTAAPVAAPTRYTVSADEAHPDVKRAAVAVAERLTTYRADETPAQVVASLTSDPAQQRALVTAAAPLWHDRSWSRGTVVYPQMGGFTANRASVMVVTRQQVGHGTSVARTETRTLDVWVTRTPSGGWSLDHLDSAGGTPAARPASLSPEAAAVLGDRRITLPDTARWDIYRGLVSPRLLVAMHQLAQRTSYAVTVLQTGHPYDVFGTGHQSMHTKGLAFDVNAVDGTHVVDERTVGSRTWQLAQWLFAQPTVGQVGSPWDFDGPARDRSFTDTVHWDHLHVSV